MADFLSEGESSLPQPERAGLAVSPAPGGNDKEEDKDKDKYEDKYEDKDNLGSWECTVQSDKSSVSW